MSYSWTAIHIGRQTLFSGNYAGGVAFYSPGSHKVLSYKYFGQRPLNGEMDGGDSTPERVGEIELRGPQIVWHLALGHPKRILSRNRVTFFNSCSRTICLPHTPCSYLFLSILSPIELWLLLCYCHLPAAVLCYSIQVFRHTTRTNFLLLIRASFGQVFTCFAIGEREGYRAAEREG